MATDERYTTQERVNRLLRLPDPYTATSFPSIEQVQSLIEQKMQIIDDELKDSFHLSEQTDNRDMRGDYLYQSGVRIPLTRRNIITPLATASGDSLKVWNGSTDEEFVGVKTESRSGDFWLKAKDGYLYLRTSYWRPRHQAIEIVYRYNSGGRTALDDATDITATDTTITVDSTVGFPAQGYIRMDDEEMRYNAKTSTTFTVIERGAFGTTAVAHLDNAIVFWCPRDVMDACTKMVAVDLLTAEDWSSGGMTSGEMPSGQLPVSGKIDQWRKDIEDFFYRRKPVLVAIE